MKVDCSINGKPYTTTLRDGFDCSIPMVGGDLNVNAYYLNDPTYSPFVAGSFIGSVREGGTCNCEDITFNPHGNGTHTECVGHISSERITIHQSLLTFHFTAQLITVEPQIRNGDLVIDLDHFPELNPGVEALVIRTLPNNSKKYHKRYSGTNPPYLSKEVTTAVRMHGIKHLIVDLPSVDKESDGGALAAHHAFWNYPAETRVTSTITELAVIPNEAKDGLYLLNLQIAAFESDASPSKPILYPLTPA